MVKTAKRFDSLEQEVFLSMWRTYDRLRLLEDELFSDFQLTPQQYNVLRILKVAYPGSMRTLDLSSRLLSRAPDITRMLDPLEERGLIKRIRPEENRRTVCVEITAEGLELLQSIQQPLRDCHARQLGHLNKRELTQLSMLLKKARGPHEEAESSWR